MPDMNALFLLSEADRAGIIDHEYYRNFLKGSLCALGFERWSEEVLKEMEECSYDAAAKKEKAG